MATLESGLDAMRFGGNTKHFYNGISFRMEHFEREDMAKLSKAATCTSVL